MRSAYRPTTGPRRGYHVPHARAATGKGALWTPGTTVLTPTEATTGRAPAASQRPVPAPRRTSHRQGSRLTRHQRGFKQFAHPIFPSPVAARMERAALGLEPRASHPADQEPTTHARVGTGHRARTWNYTLNSHQSISNPVVHSMRATSCRTSPFRSCASPLPADAIARSGADPGRRRAPRWSSVRSRHHRRRGRLADRRVGHARDR